GRRIAWKPVGRDLEGKGVARPEPPEGHPIRPGDARDGCGQPGEVGGKAFVRVEVRSDRRDRRQRALLRTLELRRRAFGPGPDAAYEPQLAVDWNRLSCIHSSPQGAFIRSKSNRRGGAQVAVQVR